MSEYVEIGEIIGVLKQRYDRLSGLRPDFYAGFMMALKTIEDETTAANVAPVVHGCWVLVDTNEEQFFVCSKCGKKEYWESDYCPNCGCRMDGEDGESDGTKS